MAGEKFRDYALRLQDLMRHLNCTAQQRLDRIAHNSRREYQLFFGDTSSKDLSEMIALGERFEDIPAPATAPLMRTTAGIRQQPGGNAPFMSNTGNASSNVCRRCDHPGYTARDCRNPCVLFCWDCGRQGVLTWNCCRQYTEQHPQARGMTAKESPGLEKPPTAATSKVLGMRGSTLVASLSVGELPTTGLIEREKHHPRRRRRIPRVISLRKEELSEICGSLDLDTKGTVEEIRKAMTALIATPDLSTELKAKLTELEAKYASRMLQLPEGTRGHGESGALEFIARVEELCEVYDLPTDIMPRIIMELLHGKAAIWYRNNRRVWSGWPEFKQEFLKFFLPTRYLDHQVRQTFQMAGEKFRDYALRLQDLMRHLNCTAQQRLDRIAHNSRREYQLFFGDTSSKDLSEMIALGERFEDIPAPATAPLMRTTAGIRQQPGGNAPFMSNTGNASSNVCRRCDHPGYTARDCRNPCVLFCWDCGRQGVLTWNCCRQYTEQHPQARGMTAKESPGLEKPPTAAASKVLVMRGSSLVASLSVGELPTTGLIEREKHHPRRRRRIPRVIRSDTKSHSIRMADGTAQNSPRTITVEISLGVKTATLELLVVKRGVDHLTLGIDFLAEIGTVVTIAGEIVKLSRQTDTPPAREKTQTIGTSMAPHPVNALPEMARGPTVIQATGSGKVTQQPNANRSATHRRSGSQQELKESETLSNSTTKKENKENDFNAN
uniref:Retrotransposon gag domain-containing protein n=1 Tax=Glossina palpalis gambiensis TaxID=67801 RepID=A0A1B0BXI9_9MUSC